MNQSLTDEKLHNIVSFGRPVRLSRIIANFEKYLMGFEFQYSNGQCTDFQGDRGDPSNLKQYMIPDQMKIRRISVFIVKGTNFIAQIQFTDDQNQLITRMPAQQNDMTGEWMTQDIPEGKELIGLNWTAGTHNIMTGVQLLLWKPY